MQPIISVTGDASRYEPIRLRQNGFILGFVGFCLSFSRH